MIVETDRLILRDFVESDWTAVMGYQSDPRYLRYYEWTGRTPEAVQEFVGMFLDHQRTTPRTKFQLAITLKNDGLLIGNCGIRQDRAGARQADVGYELDPEHWGNGYAFEAARAMVAFAYTDLGVHRVWSWCVADNLRSAHLLEKLGMQLEGRLRDNEFYKDRRWDTLVYGMLEQEWRSRWYLE
jgi:RimJ/RimL family protein N-acetyltransferase